MLPSPAMHVLVAGCGWLGREIARRLIERGDRVTAIVRSKDSAARLKAQGVDARACDLTRDGAATALPGDLDGIVAAQSASGHDAHAYRRAYVEVTRRLLEASCAPGVPFVSIGSTGVFGQRDGSWVDEATPPLPADATAEVLVEAERLVLDGSRHAAEGMVVRCSGLYGPERTGTIARVRSGALHLGAGDETWMNFAHREDAAAVVVAALDRGRAGAIYHASDAGPARRRDVVAWIAARLGIEPASVPSGGEAGGRRGSNRRISSETTRAELGIRLAYPTFREGLAPFLP